MLRRLGDSKHRWPAWPHPVFGLEPPSSSVRSTRSESERDSQPERKSNHAAVAPPDDADSALEASVIRVAMSARNTLSSIACALRRAAT